jgi:hypothetical protein
MKGLWWVIVLVIVGIAAAVAIGILGTRNEPSTSKVDATNQLCTSVKALGSSLQTLANIDVSSATASEITSDLSAVQTAWDQVKSDASTVQNAPTGDLDSAWNGFTTAIKNVPNAGSLSDAVDQVKTAADNLVTAAQSTTSQLTDCTS